MNELEREFINQSSADLKIIFQRINADTSPPISANLRQEIFRTLHTIKGTAQTFGLPQSAKLAHSLENIITAVKNEPNFAEDFSMLLREGIAFLIESFEREDFQIPFSFNEKLSRFQTNEPDEDLSDIHLSEIPETIVSQLSEPEKNVLRAALKSGKSIYVLEIGFDLANFSAGFKNFRQYLSEKGEIIASLPCPKFSAQKKIGFQIVYASKEKTFDFTDKHRADDFTDKHRAEIIFELPEKSHDSLQGILAKIVGHGKNSAKTLDKDIEFVVFADDFQVSPQRLKLIFDLLLHLVRNAVSHAIYKKGRVIIDLKNFAGNLILSVSDNGKGLCVEKIRAKAVEKNLPTDSEDDLFHYIFLPEFSTADHLTEISGRGIGLNVVKSLTENEGGKISVKSKENEGASFEIELPLEISR